jgi:hypothetical protein
MSFTSRELRGWFHTFTSLPLVHTPNPDFLGSVFDLASYWFPNPPSATPWISEIWTRTFAGPWFQGFADPRSPDSRDFLIPHFRDFLAPDSRKNRISWNRSKVRIQGPCSAINSVSVQELAKHLRLFRTLHFAPFSQMQTFFIKLLRELVSWISVIQLFEGDKVLPSSPTRIKHVKVRHRLAIQLRDINAELEDAARRDYAIPGLHSYNGSSDH